MDSLVDLRADVAMRAEDLRIATKHRVEAGARHWAPENMRAYHRAQRWETACRKREQKARARLIRTTQAAR